MTARPHKIVTISCYADDIAHMAKLVKLLRAKGYTGTSRSDVIRYAVRVLDVGALQETDGGKLPEAPNPTHYAVKLHSGVWIAPWTGDPGRTLNAAEATRFGTRAEAEAALALARGRKPFVDGSVVMVSISAD